MMAPYTPSHVRSMVIYGEKPGIMGFSRPSVLAVYGHPGMAVYGAGRVA